MNTTTIHFAIDPLYIGSFKKKLEGINALPTQPVIAEIPAEHINITGKLLILQAHYWPKLKQKITGSGMILILGNLRRFYSWIEAANHFPAAYCSTRDSLTHKKY